MFSYNNNVKDKKLFVTVPAEIKYNFNFLNSITDLMEKVENSNCEQVYFSCTSKDMNFNKMGAAYLYNTLHFLARNKAVFASKYLIKSLQERVLHTDGAKFEKIEMKNRLENGTLQCYCFKDDRAVNQTVQILVDFIAEKNLMLENAKEFLITTIGEIFSNAFNHSDQNKVFFMYDIEWHDSDCFLVINITDFGKTIIGNVQSHQKSFYGKLLDGRECIAWAMKYGNTTRQGSGGFGLSMLVDYVSKVSGELLIFSGNCMYALKGTIENILWSKGSFCGTSVSMKIPLFDTSRAILYDEINKQIVSMDLDQI